MHGNRDLLLGTGLAAATGGTLLADPIVVDVAGTPTLLSHGDAWCTRDIAYQQFRAMTRQPQFQREFLSRALDERVAFARSVRMQSESGKSTKALDITDVTPEAVLAALREAGVRRIIHGHTHRPAAHVIDLGGTLAERWVLPDWDLDTGEPRGGFLEFVEGRPRLVFFD
ncbi:MAG: UDP-2,3-diacylglucosamine diphosphatase, partial [Burkholderiaceae bacterium]